MYYLFQNVSLLHLRLFDPFTATSRLQIFHGYLTFQTATFLENSRGHGYLGTLPPPPSSRQEKLFMDTVNNCLLLSEIVKVLSGYNTYYRYEIWKFSLTPVAVRSSKHLQYKQLKDTRGKSEAVVLVICAK